MALKNWTINSISATTETDLVQGGASAEVAVVGITICNNGAGAASVDMIITNSSDTQQAKILSGLSVAQYDTYLMDTKIMLSNQEKIRVESDIAAVSFSASGDES